jgi:hypothetical protein
MPSAAARIARATTSRSVLTRWILQMSIFLNPDGVGSTGSLRLSFATVVAEAAELL